MIFHFPENEIEDFEIAAGDLINEVTINFNYDFTEGKFLAALTKRNPLSQLLYRLVKKPYELKMVQSTRVAEKIADAVLKTSSVPEIITSFTHDARSLHVEVGDEVSITHRSGLKKGGWVNALAEVSKKDLRSAAYEIIMKPTGSLYASELVTLTQVTTAGEPGITVAYEAGVATITIYADVAGNPPVEGAEVTIAGQVQVTDKKGQARFNLQPGRYTAYIRGSGYEDAEITFNV